MNYDVKADAISLNEGPRFHTVLIIIFGKPAQENIKKTSLTKFKLCQWTWLVGAEF